jgi:hypothetical protein
MQPFFIYFWSMRYLTIDFNDIATRFKRSFPSLEGETADSITEWYRNNLEGFWNDVDFSKYLNRKGTHFSYHFNDHHDINIEIISDEKEIHCSHATLVAKLSIVDYSMIVNLHYRVIHVSYDTNITSLDAKFDLSYVYVKEFTFGNRTLQEVKEKLNYFDRNMQSIFFKIKENIILNSYNSL